MAAFKTLGQQFPQSPWARRARFAAGAALAKKGDFHAAELIYRAEAESLLSAARKAELAGILLEYADAFFQPPQETTAPDYRQALDFYRQALTAGPCRRNAWKSNCESPAARSSCGRRPKR